MKVNLVTFGTHDFDAISDIWILINDQFSSALDEKSRCQSALKKDPSDFHTSLAQAESTRFLAMPLQKLSDATKQVPKEIPGCTLLSLF